MKTDTPRTPAPRARLLLLALLLVALSPAASAEPGAGREARQEGARAAPAPAEEEAAASTGPSAGGIDAAPRERLLTFPSVDEGVVLAGTLRLPDAERFGAGPYPVLLMITGSGPQDRDETIGPHKPFKVLAEALAERGVATLRYDDRGVGGSRIPEDADVAAMTTLDLADDAEGGVAFLRDHPEVDPKRVGVLGHSEGSSVAGMLMARGKLPGPAVLLAGPMAVGRQVVIGQIPAGVAAAGANEEAVKKARAAAEELVAAIEAAERERVLDAIVEVVFYQTGGAASRQLLRAQVAPQIAGYDSKAMRFLLDYDPAPDLAKAAAPVLALFGELDRQVLVEDNVPIARKLLEAWPEGSEVRVVEGANHLFQPAETGSMQEYFFIPTTMMPEVPELIADWLEGVWGEPGPDEGAASAGDGGAAEGGAKAPAIEGGGTGA